jgi:hypothetical protein
VRLATRNSEILRAFAEPSAQGLPRPGARVLPVVHGFQSAIVRRLHGQIQGPVRGFPSWARKTGRFGTFVAVEWDDSALEFAPVGEVQPNEREGDLNLNFNRKN